MKKFKNKFYYKNFYLNIFLSVFFSHVFYRITFIDRIEAEFSLIEQIVTRKLETTSFFVESPIFTLIGIMLKIDTIDAYILFVYFTSMFLLIAIIANLKYLGTYSTLFVFTGWLLTFSWFMGHIDILSVLFIVLISKNIESENSLKPIIIFYSIILSFNHNAIAVISFLCFFILASNAKKYYFAIYSIIGQVLGNVILRIYLSEIGFSGRSRFRFVFNENVIQNSINFVSENLIALIWSGFLGFIIIFIIFSTTVPWDMSRNLFIALLICIFFTCIALDTSRIFSLSIIPIILHVIKNVKESSFLEKYMAYFFYIVFLANIIIGPYFVHGNVSSESPNNLVESYYNFIARMVNSLMSNIWN